MNVGEGTTCLLRKKEEKMERNVEYGICLVLYLRVFKHIIDAIAIKMFQLYTRSSTCSWSLQKTGLISVNLMRHYE